MDPLRPLFDSLRAFPHDDLVAGLRAVHRRRTQGTSLRDLALAPPPTEPASVLAPGAALRFLALLLDAKERLRQARAGVESEPDAAAYERARLRLRDHEVQARRHVERVDRIVDAVRDDERRRAARRSTALPDVVLRLQGPAGGLTGGSLRLVNRRAVAVRPTLRASAFRHLDGRAAPGLALALAPGELALGPDEAGALRLTLDLAGSSLAPGDEVEGEALVELAGAPELRLHLLVEVVDV